MAMLHDPGFRKAIEARLDTLRSDSPRQWGSMTVDQMLWHVNQFLAAAVGEGTLPVQKTPIPAPILRFFLIYFPWPKSAPTNKGAVAKAEHDFETERARCRALIARFVSRPIDGDWPMNASFAIANGRFESKLQARHLDHHFRQFGA